MTIFKARKEVSVLPSTLESDTIYLVRTGGGFDLYCSDATGSVAHKINEPNSLPNNSRINNIEHFYQTTKPIARGDGSALIIGDKWWKTDDGSEWFWNGTYWLGDKQILSLPTYNNSAGGDIGVITFSATGLGSGTNVVSFPVSLNAKNIFVKNIIYSTNILSGLNSSNSWKVDLYTRMTGAAAAILTSILLQSDTSTSKQLIPLNQIIAVTSNNLHYDLRLYPFATKTGNPSNLQIIVTLEYYEII